MSQFVWPPVSASNPSVGGTGITAPSSATEVAGVDSGGDLVALKVDTDGTLFVTSAGSFPVTGTVTANQGTAGVDPWPVSAAQSGTWNINNVSGTVSLPTGASTSANQTSGGQKSQVVNSSGTSVDAKTLATQVVSTDVGLVTNTVLHGLNSGGGGSYVDVKVNPSGALVVDASGSTQPVSGTVTANQGGTWSVTATQATGTNLHTVVDSGTVAATQSGTWTVQPGNTANTTPWLFVQKTPTAGTVTQAAVTVGTSAVRATVSGSAPSAARSSLVITPDPASTATFYIGSSSVTNSGSTRGVALVAGQSFTANYDAGDYYIIASVAAQTVFIMEQA